MKRAAIFLSQKRLEVAIVLLLGAFMWLWHIPYVWGGSVIGIAVFGLSVYDLPQTYQILLVSAKFIKQYSQEAILLFVLVVVGFLWQFNSQEIIMLSIAYVVVVLSLNESFIRRTVQRGIRDVFNERLIGILMLIFLALMFIWDFDPITIFFIFTAVAFVVYRWDSRIVASGALVSLALCPVILLLNMEPVAENFAVYAYYFLVITIGLQIIEHQRDHERFTEI